ncbi:hypothetical protein [Planctopirus hydrillae]|uniref:Uncharacterized protein n=1 Tax=Planctopirus hydrillae TaxID=1841610 RepID=A0A1C3E9U8_9PLAN|nr:hypothetical protein [Planctopirus hydrillae]ODA30008.1 hypothetical protein A6X21_06630 [Planctopirus hydrillae]
MLPALRFRSGQVQLQRWPVASETVIEPGDLVYFDGTSIKPASSFPWTTNLVTTQTNFAAAFVGVAHQASAAGQNAPVSIDISPLATYEYAVSSGNYTVGQTIAVHGAPSALSKQQLAPAVSTAAIARAAESVSSATTLRVNFASAYSVASSNVHAQLGPIPESEA